MSLRQFYWKGVHVPFISPWSLERTRPGTITRRSVIRGGGIAYQDESRADRRDGILWLRTAAVRGAGRPQLANVHALRQRQAMTHMLCQVCGNSALGTGDERQLFLMRSSSGQAITEGEYTAMPPIHQPCATEAVRDCPHIRKGHVAALVEYAPAWGVAGIVYDPETLRPLPPRTSGSDLEFVAYDDPLIRWTLAAREVVSLHGCTAVDLRELAAEVSP